MSINVEICGAALPRRRAIVELYRPKLHSFDEFSEGQGNIEHLDVVTTWKGLSSGHAHEILFWERATKAALESYVEETLIAMFVDKVKDVDDLPDMETIYRMLDFVNALGSQQLIAPLHALTDFMRNYYEAYGTQFRWLVNDRDPITPITNFLRTFDFFDQNDSGSCIIQMHLEGYLDQAQTTSTPAEDTIQSAQHLHIVANAISVPHRVDFSLTSAGMLKPHFQEPLLDPLVPLVPVDVNFDAIGWDGRYASVTVTKRFPENVRLERVFRLNLAKSIMSQLDDGRPMEQSTRKPKPRLPSPVVVMTVHKPQNAPYSSSSSAKHVKPRRDKKRKAQALIVPDSSSSTLREISSGSARVQGRGGISEFEAAARDHHPGVFDTYQDVIVRTARVFPKLPKFQVPIPRTENSNLIVNIMDGVSNNLTTMTMPFSKQPFRRFGMKEKTNRWVRAASRQNGQVKDDSLTLKPGGNQPCSNELAQTLQTVLDTITGAECDSNPFLALEMSIDGALKLRAWAKDNYEARFAEHGYDGKAVNREQDRMTTDAKVTHRIIRNPSISPISESWHHSSNSEVKNRREQRSEWSTPSSTPNSESIAYIPMTPSNQKSAQAALAFNLAQDTACQSGSATRNVLSSANSCSSLYAFRNPTLELEGLRSKSERAKNVHRKSYDDQSADDEFTCSEERMIRIDSGAGFVRTGSTASRAFHNTTEANATRSSTLTTQTSNRLREGDYVLDDYEIHSKAAINGTSSSHHMDKDERTANDKLSNNSSATNWKMSSYAKRNTCKEQLSTVHTQILPVPALLKNTVRSTRFDPVKDCVEEYQTTIWNKFKTLSSFDQQSPQHLDDDSRIKAWQKFPDFVGKVGIPEGTFCGSEGTVLRTVPILDTQVMMQSIVNCEQSLHPFSKSEETFQAPASRLHRSDIPLRILARGKSRQSKIFEESRSSNIVTSEKQTNSDVPLAESEASAATLVTSTLRRPEEFTKTAKGKGKMPATTPGDGFFDALASNSRPTPAFAGVAYTSMHGASSSADSMNHPLGDMADQHDLDDDYHESLYSEDSDAAGPSGHPSAPEWQSPTFVGLYREMANQGRMLPNMHISPAVTNTTALSRGNPYEMDEMFTSEWDTCFTTATAAVSPVAPPSPATVTACESALFAEREQKRIRANYEEFRAKHEAEKEELHTTLRNASHPGEDDDFEDVFMASPASLSTVDIDVETDTELQSDAEGAVETESPGTLKRKRNISEKQS